MADAALSEPRVLAHTKRALFPSEETPNNYAVVDTQFATTEWRKDERITDSVREQLAPFNHVQIGTGFPDLVGVGHIDPGYVADERPHNRPPLVAVEAKGHASGGVDVERGVVQAHDRLVEANVAFVVAPAGAIGTEPRTLARELNVGVLGVDEEGSIEPLERPRVLGNRTSREGDAIRFQATAQGVADKSFGLNHPKNYLAYPLAVAHSADTEAVVADRVVRAVDSARTGAVFLDLVTDEPDGPHLTALGEEVVRFAIEHEGSVDAALECFADWRRSQKRFVELAPAWGMLTRRVVWAYPATRQLVEAIQEMHERGHREPTLVDLVEHLFDEYPTFTVELFVRGTDDARGRVLDEDGELKPDALRDGSVYHSPTVFQLKAICYHAGILTERGAEPNRLEPEDDVWALRTVLP